MAGGSLNQSPLQRQLVVSWAPLNSLHPTWFAAYQDAIANLLQVGLQLVAPIEVPTHADLLLVPFRADQLVGQQSLLVSLARRTDITTCRAAVSLVAQCGQTDPPVADEEVGQLADALQMTKVRNHAQLQSPEELNKAVQRLASYADRSSGYAAPIDASKRVVE